MSKPIEDQSRDGALRAAARELEIDPKLADRGLIFRHSGLAMGYWRMVGAHPLDRAIKLYAEKVGALRQGSLAVVHGGKVVAYVSAPTLRTRW